MNNIERITRPLAEGETVDTYAVHECTDIDNVTAITAAYMARRGWAVPGHHDIEDAAQDAALSLLEKDGEDCQFRVAQVIARAAGRAANRAKHEAVIRRHAVAAEDAAQAEEWAEIYDTAQIGDILKRLHPRMAKVLSLRFIEGLPMDKVADALGCSRVRASNFLHEALREATARSGQPWAIATYAARERAQAEGERWTRPAFMTDPENPAAGRYTGPPVDTPELLFEDDGEGGYDFYRNGEPAWD